MAELNTTQEASTPPIASSLPHPQDHQQPRELTEMRTTEDPSVGMKIDELEIAGASDGPSGREFQLSHEAILCVLAFLPLSLLFCVNYVDGASQSPRLLVQACIDLFGYGFLIIFFSHKYKSRFVASITWPTLILHVTYMLVYSNACQPFSR